MKGNGREMGRKWVGKGRGKGRERGRKEGRNVRKVAPFKLQMKGRNG